MGLTIEHVSYVYDPDAPLPQRALEDICLTIPEGQFIGIIGHTGSGKSTLMQHLNGLVRPPRDIFILTDRILTPKDLTGRNCAAKWDWSFSTRNTSYSR